MYLLNRMALKMTKAWARTYHQGSSISPFSAFNFSLTISLLATTTSEKSRASIFAPLVRTEGAGLLRAKKP